MIQVTLFHMQIILDLMEMCMKNVDLFWIIFQAQVIVGLTENLNRFSAIILRKAN